MYPSHRLNNCMKSEDKPIEVTNEMKALVRAPNKGGARAYAGRPKGATNKLSAKAILEAIEAIDEPFEIGLAKDYQRARQGNDMNLIQKYQQMIMNKVVITEPVAITVTDNINAMSESEIKAKIAVYAARITQALPSDNATTTTTTTDE